MLVCPPTLASDCAWVTKFNSLRSWSLLRAYAVVASPATALLGRSVFPNIWPTLPQPAAKQPLRNAAISRRSCINIRKKSKRLAVWQTLKSFLILSTLTGFPFGDKACGKILRDDCRKAFFIYICVCLYMSLSFYWCLSSLSSESFAASGCGGFGLRFFVSYSVLCGNF